MNITLLINNKKKTHISFISFFSSLLFLFFTDFICADFSSSSIGKNTFNSFTDTHPNRNLVSNVTTQIGTHAYLPCKVNEYKQTTSA